ncbi:MAG: bifunctional (p)ppGpp synthetase/guanosine-3',5'-bis(diphosphate) 3'-pyrophosphohydrolase [Candidatus Macondimonas sp.]
MTAHSPDSTLLPPAPPATADAMKACLASFPKLAPRALQAGRMTEELGLGEDAVLAAMIYPLMEADVLPPSWSTPPHPALPWGLLKGLNRLRIMDELAPSRATADPDAQLERLRKMLLAMVEDARVVVIKLCYRLHTLESAKNLPAEEQRQLAQQTLDLFAPLANRLGIWQIKWQLEDWSLRYLHPDAYHKIASWLDERRTDRERYIQETIRAMQEDLDKHHIHAAVTGRPKHLYSIWRKLERKGMSFSGLFDARAIRVLVDDIPACYAVLGLIHGRWQPIPGQFDDYIASPKENNYQSLHTAVIGPAGKTLEVQIRTHRMHEQAELGVAAHWRYKEGGAAGDAGLERRIAWLRKLLESSGEDGNAEDFLDRFRAEIGEERVYVITPRGDIHDLPAGATPLDFAYAVHTDVGHRCRGARINGAIAPLTRALQNGDRVEILTAKELKPSRDWLISQLGYLTTSRARAKVRQWFKHEDYNQNLATGRDLLERELHRLGLGDEPFEALAARFNYAKVGDFLAAIGAGDLSTAQIAGRLQPVVPREIALPAATGRELPPTERSGIHVHGVGRMLTTLARCCSPVPPEPITGYITKGRGITVHRQDCRNALRLEAAAAGRMVEVSWGDTAAQTYPITIRVEAYDRPGLLRDITVLLASQRINVLGANTHTDKESGHAVMDLILEITGIAQLSDVLGRISRFPNITSARRHN